MFSLILPFFRRSRARASETIWHKTTDWTGFGFRLTDGSWSKRGGQIWRRRTSKGWEYRQDAETEEQWQDRQW
jgi:hypothetical protein